MKEKLHNDLVAALLNKGECFPKKHGQWVRYWISKTQFLMMDSWNKAIYLREGTGEYEYWCGFSGKQKLYFGNCWGGFESEVAPQVYQSALSCF